MAWTCRRGKRRDAVTAAAAFVFTFGAAVCALDMNVNLAAGGVQSFVVENIRKVTYDLTAPATMQVLMRDNTSTPLELTAVRSVTFTGVWTGAERRLERIKTQLTRLSFRRFGGAATLSFSLTRDDDVRVAVFGIDGRLVRMLVDERLGAGDHIVFWDGADGRGRRVATGTYVLRLEREREARAFRFVTVR